MRNDLYHESNLSTCSLTAKEYLEFKDGLETRITVKRGLLNEKRIDIIDIATVLRFMKFYLTHLDSLFAKASPEGRPRIGSSIFPSGVVFDGELIRTPVLGRGYKLTNDFNLHIPFGERPGARTLNPQLKRLLLYQLS